MADLLTITQVDIENADAFLTAYLQANIPTADFSQGGVVRDYVVTSMAYIFAFFRNEANDIAAHTSLLKLQQLPASTSVDAGVDAILSNWFLTRNAGKPASLPTKLHFSQASDVTIQPTTQFTRAPGFVYTTGLTQSLVVPASQLTPNLNADGTVADYSCYVTLVASAVGTGYNAAPGIFSAVDPFSPYFVYAENTDIGYNGKDVETTSQLLTRAPTAISVRNLINQRSIEATLSENFDLTFLRVIGMGDPEMMRDFVNEGLGHFQMHLGGYTDIFVSLDRMPFVETLPIGAAVIRPDNQSVVLRDTSIDFTTLPIVPGNVLYISAGLPTVPMTYIITSIETTTLEVSPLSPFSLNTDEISGGSVTYNVGQYAPAYTDYVSGRTGQTSRKFQQAGCVLLTGQPHYKITDVSVVDATTNALTSLTKINVYDDATLQAGGTYYVWSLNPQLGQSNQDGLVVEVSRTAYAGDKLQVTYETLSGYSDIAAYVADSFQRVSNANQLVRGLHPVYLEYTIKYITAVTAVVPIDETASATALANFVDTWNMSVPLSNSDASSFLKTTFPSFGAIYNPFELTYVLYAPDGQEYWFSTTDIVTISPDFTKNSAHLTNGASLRVPIYGADLDPAITANQASILAANQALAAQLAAMGISDRNIRFVVDAGDVTFVNMANVG